MNTLTDYRLALLGLQKQYEHYLQLSKEPKEAFTRVEHDKLMRDLKHSRLAVKHLKNVIYHLEKIG